MKSIILELKKATAQRFSTTKCLRHFAKMKAVVRENKDFAGTTPDSGIIVKEKNGKEFSILRSGKDFEVQRKDALGQIHSYWAIQKEIKTLLDELSH